MRRELGYPAHFIAANYCKFRRATVVGRYIVSSVGDYRPHGLDGVQETIGSDRTFETMVFRRGPVCDCGCGEPRINSGQEIDFAPAKSAPECAKNHERLCRKYEQMQKSRRVGGQQ